MNAEQARIEQNDSEAQRWHLWGPYLSERKGGTVREDYSANGEAWNYLPHDQARSRAYRWGEDGLAGISDYKQRLCFAWAFWNGQDPILKERLFGLAGPQGNHGEDVKELYWYLDNTPSHSYMRMLYRYPQTRFPYDELVSSNAARSRAEPEFELWQTNVLAENRYFDIEISYAKATPDDILIRATAINRGTGPATLHFLPTIWFRNTWSWGRDPRKPSLREATPTMIEARHDELGSYQFHCENAEQFLFTENESNLQRLWGVPNHSPFVKDGINDAVVNGTKGTVNPEGFGTKVAAHYSFVIAPGATETVMLRLSATQHDDPFADAEKIFEARQVEADSFYMTCGAKDLSEDARAVQRQAFAGMLWSKQFYYYDVDMWLHGDPAGPPPPH